MRRGFSAVELAVCVSILTILMPITWQAVRRIEERQALGLWHARSADEVRTVTEELRLDARRGAPTGELTWTIGACEVRYRVSDATLHRDDSCGTTRALARDVESFAAVPSGVDLVLARTMRPGQVYRATVFIPLEGR